MKTLHLRLFPLNVALLGMLSAVALGVLAPAGTAAAQDGKPKALRIAIVTFFSGSGAVVGGPSVNAAKLTIDQINQAGGIDGVPIEAKYIDESGGASKNIATFRQVAGDVDVVMGYVSSSDCLAVAPVAEELAVPTIFTDCTTNSLFEGHHYKWVFRTQPPASANALAGAMYVLKTHPDIQTIAGINQDYAFGRDQWKYFSAAMRALKPGIKVEQPLFTKLFSGSYDSQISRLLGMHPDLVYSSFWGGDLVAFIQQSAARNLFAQSQVALSLGTQGGVEGLKALPPGVIVGSEHSYLFHPGKIANARLAKFVEQYHARFHQYPVSTYPYTLRRAVITLRDGYQRAIAANGGKWPSKEQFAHALAGLKVDTIMGPMIIRQDHQATYHEMYGISTKPSPQYGFPVFDKIITFPADLIMPPEGTADAEKWIESLEPSVLDKVPAPKTYNSGG